MSRVTVVGLGYVGLPLAVRAAEVGHVVHGVDLDERKTRSLRERESYIEDVSSDQIRRLMLEGRFGASNEVDRTFDVAVIAVPTPLKDGEPDLSYIVGAGAMIGPRVMCGSAVVLESTTYPGTTEGILREVLERTSGLTAGTDFYLGFSPERIDPGASEHTLQNTPKLVSATTPEGLGVIRRFYDTIVDVTVPVSSPRVAELTKVYENTQANVNIALINEIASLCRDLDIDVHEMVEASMTKGHSMARWLPGPGVGGHCLPIDPMYLAWQARAQLGRRFRFAELADEINSGRPNEVVDLAGLLLNEGGLPFKDTDVLVLGVAYKPGVGDVRESPALPIIDGLAARGAKVTVCDPYVTGWDRTPTIDVGTLYAELPRFPLVIVVTHHEDVDYEKIATARRVLDTRNVVPAGAGVVAL